VNAQWSIVHADGCTCGWDETIHAILVDKVCLAISTTTPPSTPVAFTAAPTEIVRPGKIGGELAKTVGVTARQATRAKAQDHHVARVLAESMVETTDVDFAIVIAFNVYEGAGVAHQLASVAAPKCPAEAREVFGHVSEATSMAISNMIHTLTGENVMVMDRTDRADDEDPTTH
jgi:hypothetical protein